LDEELKPVVYAGIIDEIGRTQYSGGITWLREYIQNAVDGGAKTVHISFHGNDFEIVDDGDGMNQEILVKQAFSIGQSFKNPKAIGELGIGMYAGTGICDRVMVRTKMKEDNAFLASLDLKKYREIISSRLSTTFDEAIGEIFSVKEDNSEDDPEQFTIIRFENLTNDAINLIEKEDLKRFLEFTVDLPINENFKHKQEVLDFIGEYSSPINVVLEENGTTTNLTKFNPGSIEFTDTFWSKEIKDGNNPILKIWAVYNKAGSSMGKNARILLKRKGITVGDSSYVGSKFGAKYSERYFGEIILLDDRIEINTSRDWFVSSQYLSELVEKTKSALNELYGIADFDSKHGVGIINLRTKLDLVEDDIKHVSGNNPGLKLQKEQERNKIKEKLQDKIEETKKLFKKFSEDMVSGKRDPNNPTNKMERELLERVLNNPEIKSSDENSQTSVENSVKTPRKQNWPKVVITFLREKIIDAGLANEIGNGDIKDITDRAFTYIEQTLKGKVRRKELEKIDWATLISEFKKKYTPPDLRGFSLEEYMGAFDQIMKGTYTILRNTSHHSFMKNMDNSRHILQVMLFADFIVEWLNQWTEK